MAASAQKMIGVCEESSSSDDEELRRCEEAVWEPQPYKKKDADCDVKPSKRLIVAEHEHDGNELQVSQGFRTHVAKKLTHILDSLISEKQPETFSCGESATHDVDNDEGFRLFSTSIPEQTAAEPPATVRRRPIPSSSDSDSEKEARLKEAAVSLKDLLPSSSLPSTNSTEKTPCAEKIKKKKKLDEGEDSRVVKKKKKKKLRTHGSEQVDSELAINNDRNSDHKSEEETQVKVKHKKKKKKQTEGSRKKSF